MSTPSPPLSDSRSPRHDRRAATSTVRWRREVPEAIRSLGALANADYADIVTATIDVMPAEPDEVVHAALNRLPRGLLLLIPFVQRVFLGLRLKLRPSPDHLLGWKIVDRGENWIRIYAASWFLTGHVVMHVDNGQISFASFIRYDRRLAAFVWPPVSLIHRRVALALVRSAIRVINT
ncbi:MAG TPA: hypothetical protein VLJ42_01400 [Solirubrobacteraceae bacterium]|nr:hypothetical protein [Solirubrobacteraceae bacterium]